MYRGGAGSEAKISPAVTGHCPSGKWGGQGDKMEAVSERPATLDLQRGLPHPYPSSHCLGGEGKGRHSYRKDGGPGEAGAGLGQQRWGRLPLPDAQFPGRPASCQGGEASPTPSSRGRGEGYWGPAPSLAPTPFQPSELCFAGGKGGEEVQASGVGQHLTPILFSPGNF